MITDFFSLSLSLSVSLIVIMYNDFDVCDKKINYVDISDVKISYFFLLSLVTS